MQDSVSEDHPDEPDSSADDLTTATFNFTFKTYLFAGMAKAKFVPATVTKYETSVILSDIVVEIQPDEID